MTITQSSATATILKHLAGTRIATHDELAKAVTVLTAGAGKALSVTLLTPTEHAKALAALERQQAETTSTPPAH